MAELRVLNSYGDSLTVYDPKATSEEATAAVAEAEEIFKRERSRGSSAFKVVPGQPAVRIDAFDKTADEIIIIPRMVGG